MENARRRRRRGCTQRQARAIAEALERRALLTVGPIPTVPTPAAHWTFDAGSGTSAVDSSGNGHTGSLGTSVTWAGTGNVGTHAINLNGTAASVVTATGPVVNTAASFTVSAWVKLSSLSGYQTVVSIAGTSVAGFFLQLRGDTGTFAFTRLSSDATGTATYVASPIAPTTNTWYHLVGVDDVTAGTLALYVDGQTIGTTPYTSAWAANGNTLIGHGFYSGGQVDYVSGSIDDVQMFSSALSAAQVVALDQPAAYSFDDGTGSTAADITGHGNTLTLASGASWTAGHTGSNALAVNNTSTGYASQASPVVNTSQPFSVSAWVDMSNLSANQTFVSIDGTNESGFYLQYRTDTGKFAFTRFPSDASSPGSVHADGLTAPTTGTWYNLIGVDNIANSQLLLYVNGVLQSSVTYSGNWQATGATVIGSGKFGGNRTDFASGAIDDVHFFNYPLTASDAAYYGTNGGSVINVATNSTGITVSPDLFGAFMEDINYGGEGGIYNDEIRNSGFNDSTNALNAWSAITGTGVTASLASDTTTGPTTALTQSGKLTITSGVNANARAGIANTGYFGVAVTPATSYSVQFYAMASSGFTGPLTVDLESTSGTVYATATVSAVTSSWAQYSVTLTTSASVPTSSTNRIVISTSSPSANGSTLWIGAAYLFPPAYNNASNHLRTDLMQKLAALNPAIFRVPGGNYLEGNTYADRFEWSNTIGPIQNRPGHYNSAWSYWSTDGMGLDEYLQMAEELGSQPVLAVYAGYTLKGTSDTGTTLSNDVTDAVNELHYVLDPTTTTWGAMRAANGHPAPYDVQDVEVGNEDFFSSTYSTRYPLFYNAIHSAFPSLKLIATSSSTGGSPFDVLDDHFYNSPAWFEANSHYFDNTARGSYKIFVGEYAANEGSPTNDLNSALGDASWLLGLERNSDLVTMSSYAPVWVNVNGHQWTPDLIGFDNTSSYGSPSYWAQVMLSNNRGNTVVSSTTAGASGLQVLVTRTRSTYYVTVVNTLGASNPASINLTGVTGVSSSGTVISMSGASTTSTNSITNPTNIVPVTSSLSNLATNFNYTFPGYSVTVLQFNADSTPSVATAASSSNSPVTGTTTNLSVLGADASGEGNLNYTWGLTGTPPYAVSYSDNGTNTAKNTTVTFASAGTYNFLATIANGIGQTVTSVVTVTVNQTLAAVNVTPSSGTTLVIGSTQQYNAAALDQFSAPISGATFTWTASGGTISNTGLFTAGQTPGSFSVTASYSGFNSSSGGTIQLPTWLGSGSVATWTPATHTLNVTGGASIIADPGSDEPIIQANGSSAVITVNPTSGAPIHIGGVNLANSATMTVTSLGAARTSTNYRVLVIGALGAAPPPYAIDSTSTLDLTDNDMALLYGSSTSPLSSVATELQSAYDNRAWDKPGLTSSIARNTPQTKGLGFAEASALGITTFDGQSVGSNAVLVKYTTPGDADLSGSVDLADYTTVIRSMGQTGLSWINGNFDYSGNVGLADYTTVVRNIGTSTFPA